MLAYDTYRDIVIDASISSHVRSVLPYISFSDRCRFKFIFSFMLTGYTPIDSAHCRICVFIVLYCRLQVLVLVVV